MTDRNRGATAPSKGPSVSPLVIHIDGFGARLGREVYTPGSVHDKCVSIRPSGICSEIHLCRKSAPQVLIAT
jgi:hypothetical protein